MYLNQGGLNLNMGGRTPCFSCVRGDHLSDAQIRWRPFSQGANTVRNICRSGHHGTVLFCGCPGWEHTGGKHRRNLRKLSGRSEP